MALYHMRLSYLRGNKYKRMQALNTEMMNKPAKRLSWWRVLGALLLLACMAYGTTLGVSEWREAESVVVDQPWFAAYVDVTSTPTYAFEQLGSTPTSAAVLAFIVASTDDACRPTWGTYYTLDEGAVALNLDRRIARLQQQGGRIAVSFGGALNSELALGCTDADQLLQAYASVVDRYAIDTIDFDIENQALRDADASKRRAIAIARLQENYRGKDKHLAVWLTLPVAPQGLTREGTDSVAQMLAAGVDLAGVNLMTMDYGASREPGQTMLAASQQALIETHRQLGILYKQAGIDMSSDGLWQKIGATPMIGQNDFTDEVFTLEDAKAFTTFAHERGIGRMSMWSANRDAPCGENYVDVKRVSDSCSGVKDPKGSFAQALSAGFDGDLTQSATVLTVVSQANDKEKVDDPEKSPYQIWQETGTYPKGVKVVWHGNVYEAKWWTKNDIPDNPVLQSWETPWRLMGPVLPGEKPIQQPKLPKDVYPAWSGTVIYNGGDRVLFDGIPFQSKWWNEGESPAASSANPDSSPWIPLTQAQIMDILKASN